MKDHSIPMTIWYPSVSGLLVLGWSIVSMGPWRGLRYVSLKRMPSSISKPDKGNQFINYGGICMKDSEVCMISSST